MMIVWGSILLRDCGREEKRKGEGRNEKERREEIINGWRKEEGNTQKNEGRGRKGNRGRRLSKRIENKRRRRKDN